MGAMGQPGRGGFTALVIEDEPLIALDTEDMLRGFGATDVSIVSDFGSARSQVDACRYGVVVFDLDLGGTSTEPLVQECVRMGCNTIVISGSEHPPASLAGTDVRVLTKPVNEDALRGALADSGLTLSA